MTYAFQKCNAFSSDMQHDSEAMLRSVSERCKKLEDITEKLMKKKDKDGNGNPEDERGSAILRRKPEGKSNSKKAGQGGKNTG